MKSNEIRQTFLEFFKDRDHRVVPSSSLVPHNDPTLLFTNAGMNQFKNVFLGAEKRDYSRATTCQKVVRAGGKHNDLENVGKTARHHTFFEMLGNFSFGDYFKKDAVAWAWELVTQGFKMDGQRIWISIHHSDDEAFGLWKNHVGVPANRIVRLGDKDNFWSMGETGPCGPCSELYYDQGPAFGCGRAECSIECECGRYTEFWNLVFMQFNRGEDGVLVPLPRPSIDTGAGLERTAALIQGVPSNFETDLILPIIEFAAGLSGISWKKSEETDIALKVIADHARATTFLVVDGVTPSNEGRGYVLRKIIRRALRYGRTLRFGEAFLFQVTGKVIDLMQSVYPDLTASRNYVAQVCEAEERKFKSVVESATARLEEIFEQAAEQKRTTLLGAEVFKLYDTFGLPIDFVQEMANERNFTVDVDGFEKELENQRKSSAWIVKKGYEDTYTQFAKSLSKFTGYSTIVEKGCLVQSIIPGDGVATGAPVMTISKGESGQIILDKTCFYAESGGQLGDRGTLKGSTGTAMVIDTFTPIQGLIVHRVKVVDGHIDAGGYVDAYVDPAHRQSVRKNHTATHLLHAALRGQLGDHVKQAGSLVAPDHLRFDFTHYTGLKAEDVRALELKVNEKVLTNIVVETKETTVDEAIAEGAMALFGEKYGDRVRMVRMGDFSKELCGGTHCGATGEVGAFLVVQESSTAAGIRRIEALTGSGALDYVQQERRLLEDLTSTLKISRDEILKRVQDLMDRNKKLEKELERLKTQNMLGGGQQDLSREETLPGGRKILVKLFPEADADQLGHFVDEMFKKKEYAIVTAGSIASGAVAVRVEEGNNASELFRNFYVPIFGGGGGGRKDFAKGGLKKLSEMPAEESLSALVQAISKYKAG